MKLKILFVTLSLALSFSSLAQSFEEEYQSPEYEDEMLTEDMYYQSVPMGEIEAQEEESFSEYEQSAWDTEEVELPLDSEQGI